MSPAEYAPKQLPVLTRLAMALRRIPAIDFAVAKFKALLRGRTDAEPASASELQAPAVDVATDNVGPGEVEATPVESETPQADPADTESAAAGPVKTNTDEIKNVESDALAVETGIAEIDSAQTSPVAIEGPETGAVEIGTVETVAVRTDDAAADAVPADGLPEQDAVAAESGFLPVGAVESEIVELERDEIEYNRPGLASPLPDGEMYAVERDPVEAVVDTAVETDTIEVELIEAEAVEVAPVETVIATTDGASAAGKVDDLCDRETLIRRRWKETGIRMWNPRQHGAGHALCIQGRVALLPPKPGETMPGYDRLEFKLIDGLIVCEGFVVDPPGQKQRASASVAFG